ncbi:MAG: hypothetical protein LBF72_01250 [Holosporales bacterium]|nr:hypothetical protein [Holosporales bacterium]
MMRKVLLLDLLSSASFLVICSYNLFAAPQLDIAHFEDYLGQSASYRDRHIVPKLETQPPKSPMHVNGAKEGAPLTLVNKGTKPANLSHFCTTAKDVIARKFTSQARSDAQLNLRFTEPAALLCRNIKDILSSYSSRGFAPTEAESKQAAFSTLEEACRSFADIFFAEQSPLDVQQAIIDSQAPQNPKVRDLSALTAKGFILTDESVEELSNNFPAAIISVDIFDNDNFLIATKLAIEAVTDIHNSTFSVISQFVNNPQLRDYFSYILLQLDILLHLPEHSFANSEFARGFMNLFKTLKEAYVLLKNNYSLPENHYFTNFIYNAVKVQQVMLARYITYQFFDATQSSVEQEMLSKARTSDVTISASVPLPILGLSVGGDSTTSTTASGTTSSFYTVNVGEKLRVSIAADVEIAGLGAGLGLGLAKSLIFYSLEQVIDSGVHDIVISNDDLKKLRASRSHMQEREKELLRRFGELEGFYKICKVIPQGTYLNWVDLSHSAPVDTVSTYSAAGDLAAQLAQAYQMSLTRTVSNKTYKRQKDVLAMLTSDCRGAHGLTASDIEELLGHELNVTEKIGSLQMLYGSLVAYNSILEQLANDHSVTEERELHKQKREYEKMFLPEGFFQRLRIKGREGVLKACALTACAMRERSEVPEELVIFRKLYEQLSRLERLCEFSKNSKNDSLVDFVAKGRSVLTKGELSIALPAIGKADVSVVFSSNSGNPCVDENGDFADVRLSVPVNDKFPTLGEYITQKVRDIASRMEAASAHPLLKDIANIFNIASNFWKYTAPAEAEPKSLKDSIPLFSDAHEIVVKLKLVKSNAAQAGGDFGEDWPGTATKASRPLVALPGQTDVVIRKENRWVPFLVQVISKTDMKISGSVKMVGANVHTSSAQVKGVLCEDALHAVIAKYNALRLGNNRSQSVSAAGDPEATNGLHSLWSAFLESQKDALHRVLRRVADKESNSHYELQGYYNDVVAVGEEKKLDMVDKVFEQFLRACSGLSEGGWASDKQYEKTSKLLNRVLELIYQNSFLPQYNAAYFSH